MFSLASAPAVAAPFKRPADISAFEQSPAISASVLPEVISVALEVMQSKPEVRARPPGFDAFKLAGLATDWDGLTQPDIPPRGAAICDAIRAVPVTPDEGLPYDPASVLAKVLDSDFCAVNSGRPKDKFRFPDKL